MRAPTWLRSRRALRDERDAARTSASHWRAEFDQLGAILCEHGYHAHEGWGVLASDVRGALGMVRARHGRDVDAVADALGILTGPGIEVDVDALVEVVRAVRERARLAERDRAMVYRLDVAIEDARRVLRACGHELGDETAIGADVDRAIEWERRRRERVEDELTELRSDRARALFALLWRRDRLAELGDLDEVFAPCTCGMRDLDGRVRRDRVRRAPDTSVVDPQCPEHSPAWRYGGRPVQPLALPPAPTTAELRARLVERYGADTMDRADAIIDATLDQLMAEGVVAPDGVVDAQILDALDRWEGDATSGGWVCDACGRPVDNLPCPEHQPLALADARAEGDGVPS